MAVKTNSQQCIPVWHPVEMVADRYGVTPMTVWRWARAGQIPKPKKIGGNTTRWYGPALDEHDQKLAEVA
ncbi:MAG: DNA-binding protein [Spiribacter salinus]|uniref:DNA-binding protein n=1 Tax=Spiribacter salinus TaxID=1335746 RepID=A0A540VPP9_9GAMM|nr:MAG: DNA-binding protein [Spiribacter salinus]